MLRTIRNLGLFLVALSWRASVAASGVELAAAREQMEAYSPALVSRARHGQALSPGIRQPLIRGKGEPYGKDFRRERGQVARSQ